MANVTMLANLVNTEVLSDLIANGLEEAIKFAPLATVDSSLVGQAGDTVKLPKYAYIGDAVDVAEGEAIGITQLSASSVNVTVKKAAKGVELTDEAVLSGYGDPLGQAAAQLQYSIAQKVDSDCVAALEGIGEAMTHDGSASAINPDAVADALTRFGEHADGEKVLLIAPAQLAALRKDDSYLNASDLGTAVMMEGTVGSVHGCQIVLSDKITVGDDGSYHNFIVKPGALAIFLKRDTLVETDRNIVNKTTTATVDKHYAVYLADESKAILLKTGA